MIERTNRIINAMESELNSQSRIPELDQKNVALVEKRCEERFLVPELYRQYITLEIRQGDRFVPAVLANFSRKGILFECPVLFEKGSRTECKIKISLVLAREISFGIDVMYAYSCNGSHIMGASIDSISDQTWFDVFVEVHDFIVLRQNRPIELR